MSRVLTISSQVVFGPVGNSATVPALQSYGHDVMQIPTVVLSHHPGHGRPVSQDFDAELLQQLLHSVEQAGGLQHLAGVLTGYFARAEQVAVVARCIRSLRSANPELKVLVDPVLGDQGKLYVAQDVAKAIKSELLPEADIITPNAFELGWLSGVEVYDRASAEHIAKSLNSAEVVVTSVPDVDHLGILLVGPNGTDYHRSPKLDCVPNGTGDYFAGHYLGARLRHDSTAAFFHACTALEIAIGRSAGTTVLSVV